MRGVEELPPNKQQVKMYNLPDPEQAANDEEIARQLQAQLNENSQSQGTDEDDEQEEQQE